MQSLEARKYEKRTRRRARRPGVKQQNLFSQRRIVHKSKDLNVAHMSKPTMCHLRHEACRRLAVLVERVYKSAFLRRSRFVYSGRTQGHATAGFFVPICPHVACRQEPGQGASYDKKSIRKVVVRVRIPEATWCLE